MARQRRQTIALTGATGFLGSAVARACAAAGHDVVALVRPTSDLRRLPEHPSVTTIAYSGPADAGLVEELASREIDAFVHMGWAGVAGGDRATLDHLAVNLPQSVATVQLAAAAGASYWLGVGSQAEYGPSEAVLDETSPRRPVTAYGTAKLATSAAALAVAEATGICAGWARVFSVYGPGDHAGAVVPYVISTLLAGEEPALGPCAHDWDLLYVEDAAAAFVALVDARIPGATNIASGTAHPLRATLELAADLVGGEARPAFASSSGASTRSLRGSVDRLTALTNWRPATPLGEGMRQTVEALAVVHDAIGTTA